MSEFKVGEPSCYLLEWQPANVWFKTLDALHEFARANLSEGDTYTYRATWFGSLEDSDFPIVAG